jgi:hypothetical protein
MTEFSKLSAQKKSSELTVHGRPQAAEMRAARIAWSSCACPATVFD